MTYSSNFKKEVNKVSGGDVRVILLEINHEELSEPIRVVNDKQDIVSNGDTYLALAFNITLPDDPEAGLPRASISIDNVSKDLMFWLEQSDGARGATATIRQVLRSDPNTIESEVTLNLTNISANSYQVSGQLGYDDILNMSANPFCYRPENAPGLF